MARVIRVYQKKRGHRLTGSRVVGSAGEAILSAAFIVMGCVGFALLLRLLDHSRVARQPRVRRPTLHGASTPASASARPAAARSTGPRSRSPTASTARRITVWTYDIHFGTGKEYSSSLGRRAGDPRAGMSKAASIPAGTPRPTRRSVVLVRGYSWWIWLTFIVPLSFIIIGGSGLAFRLLHLGTSAERRSALTRQAGRLELFDNGNGAQRKYPSIPDYAGHHRQSRHRAGLPAAHPQLAGLVPVLARRGLCAVERRGLGFRGHRDRRLPGRASRLEVDDFDGAFRARRHRADRLLGAADAAGQRHRPHVGRGLPSSRWCPASATSCSFPRPAGCG